MHSLQKIRFLSRQIKLTKNVHLRDWNQKSFHINRSLLMNEEKFAEIPKFLKKIKIKQAKMQNDDGVPVFLKRGLIDKILYNITLLLTIFCTYLSIKMLRQLNNRGKE